MSPMRAALILAGGAGTRLWPLSTDARPKQFLPIFDGRSLLQHTFARLLESFPADRIYVSTNGKYAETVLEQLPTIGRERLILEPSRRNTGPAIATSTAWIARELSDVTIGVFPADHFVRDHPAFARAIGAAIDFAAASDRVVTIAITPTMPEVGFGYLELGEEIGPGVLDVQAFIEKPDLERARELVASGRFAWNGGMFFWTPSSMRQALRGADPEFQSLVDAWSEAPAADARDALYERMPARSVDHALMEKTSRIAAVRGDFGWSDVGSWRAVAEIAGDRNVTGAILESASGVHIETDGRRPVIVAGVDRIAVVDSPDGLLVIDLDRPELLRDAVKKLGD